MVQAPHDGLNRMIGSLEEGCHPCRLRPAKVPSQAVVKPSRATKDVNRVVVAAQQSIGTEARDLFPCMALHVIWEGNLQPSRGFAFDLNRRDFFGGESIMGVEKGSGKVRP